MFMINPLLIQADCYSTELLFKLQRLVKPNGVFLDIVLGSVRVFV